MQQQELQQLLRLVVVGTEAVAVGPVAFGSASVSAAALETASLAPEQVLAPAKRDTGLSRQTASGGRIQLNSEASET